MNISWGRDRNYGKADILDFKRLISIGSLILIVGIFTLRIPITKYTEAMSEVTTHSESENAIVEPFGYYDGKWNLWEYIGDLVSSLIS